MSKSNLKAKQDKIERIPFEEMDEVLQQLENEFSSINVNDDIIDESLNSDELPTFDENDGDAIITSTTKRKRRTREQVQAERSKEIELIESFKKTREQLTWKKIQDKYWYGIKKYAYMFVKDVDLASDMTIDTFIRAYSSIDQFDEQKAKFTTWLWTICRNNCLYYLKIKGRIPTLPQDISEIYDSTISDNCQDSSTYQYVVKDNEVQQVDSESIERQLYDVSLYEMSKLHPTMSKVMEMKLVKNMKIREIADALEMTESNVKNYLYSGKDRLAEIIKTSHKDLYEMFLDAKADQDHLTY